MLYDGDGNRSSKSTASVTTSPLVDDINPTGYAMLRIEEVSSGVVQRVYTYGLSRISESRAISGSWTPAFYGYDGDGDVRFLTDASGAITDTYDYDSFGNLVGTTGTTPNSYLYKGENFDADLNLYYLRARWYDPVTMRLLSRDPLDNGNKYTYSNADPVNGSDPSGMGSIEKLSLFILVLRNPAIWQAAARVVIAGRDVVVPVTQAGLQFYCIMKLVGSGLANVEAAFGIVPNSFWSSGKCSLPLVIDPYRPLVPGGPGPGPGPNDPGPQPPDNPRQDRERVIVKRGVNANNPGELRTNPDLSAFEVLKPQYKCVLSFVVEYTPPKVDGVAGNVIEVFSDHEPIPMPIASFATYTPSLGDLRVGLEHWSLSPGIKPILTSGAIPMFKLLCPNLLFK